MSWKKCLLQSTTKFRILLYRHKRYVSLHIFGSFPKALYQSFSLGFNSEPLPSSTAEQIISPSARRRVVLRQPLSAVRSGAAWIGCSLPTRSAEPSSQGYIAQKKIWWEVVACVAASVLSAISTREEKGIKITWTFISCKAQIAAGKWVQSCFSTMWERTLLFLPLSLFLVVVQLWSLCIPSFPQVIIHVPFARQDRWGGCLLSSFRGGE